MWIRNNQVRIEELKGKKKGSQEPRKQRSSIYLLPQALNTRSSVGTGHSIGAVGMGAFFLGRFLVEGKLQSPLEVIPSLFGCLVVGPRTRVTVFRVPDGGLGPVLSSDLHHDGMGSRFFPGSYSVPTHASYQRTNSTHSVGNALKKPFRAFLNVGPRKGQAGRCRVSRATRILHRSPSRDLHFAVLFPREEKL